MYFLRLLFLVFFLSLTVSSAQYYKTISYQGYLSDTSGTPIPDDTYRFIFRLYEGCTESGYIWEENKSIKTRQGLFSTYLGDLIPFPSAVFMNTNLWLGITVQGEPEMNPRLPFTSVSNSFHSFRSDTASYVLNGSTDSLWQFCSGNISRLSGNVGIGVTNPVSKLQIENGSILVKGNGYWFNGLCVNNAEGRGVISIGGVVNQNNYSSSELELVDNSTGRMWGILNDSQNKLVFFSRLNDTYYHPLKIEPGAPDNSLYISSDGNTGIGTTDTKNHKLAVAGSIAAEEIVVKLQSDWPDYVFDENYKLDSPAQLKKYTQQNKHLPGVPSRNEISQTGLPVSSVQLMLLQKIEELTLHIIKLNDRIDSLETRISNSK